MILGTGVDIMEVPRMEASINRFGDHFLKRVFTDAEIAYCDSKTNRFERYAARFAAKEAALKAIGTGWRGGISWRDVEVQRQKGGRPVIAYSGKAGEVSARLGVKRAWLSISHTKEYAIAQVIVED